VADLSAATEKPRCGYVVEIPFTPDDIGSVDDPPALYRKPDGSVGPLFTEDELARLGSLFDPPLAIPPSPDR
jgi:hypothetical protein